MSTRSTLYRAARLLGDVQAVQRGRYPQRVIRRAAYRHTNKALRSVLRTVGL